jgi:hypothetical protein
MWRTDTYWLDVAIVTSLLTLGSILFGRFEEHKPRWRRVLKAALGTALIVGVSVAAGRAWAFALVLGILAAAAGVHLWWLPKHGVDGWTGEPRERYYALLGLDSRGQRRDRRE